MNFQSRKPISQLTRDDLQNCKIWEFATGEEGRIYSNRGADEETTYSTQDEKWVRPVDGTTIQRNKSSLIAAANFATPIGLKFAGLVCVSTFGDVQFGPGALLISDSFIAIPALPPHGSATYRVGDTFDLEAFGTHEAIKQVKVKGQNNVPQIPELGIPSEEIFPLRFELALNVEGETSPRCGVFRV